MDQLAKAIGYSILAGIVTVLGAYLMAVLYAKVFDIWKRVRK